MRSFTSSSDTRKPQARWGAVWGLTLLSVAVLLGAWEISCRVRGLGPRVPDDVYVWANARQQVESNSVVLIGASRMQGAIDLPTLAAESGRDVVQLSIAATSPVPVLESLAENPEFTGTIIVGVVPHMMFSRGVPYESEASAYVEQYRRMESSPGDRLEVRLQTAVARVLCVRNPVLLPWRRELWQSPPKVRESAPMSWTRQRFYDRDEKIGAEKENVLLRVDSAAPPPTRKTRDRVLERIAAATRRVERRGGEVVFVRLPSSRSIATFERRRAPRAKYWDVLARRVNAPAIHFADVPGMRSFVLYDGSHVHRRDSAEITRALWGAISP